MPSKRAQTWPGISASLFACLLLGQLAATVDAETFVGQGEVGGYVNSYAVYGRIAAEDTMRTLKGDRPRDIPLLERTNIKPFEDRKSVV